MPPAHDPASSGEAGLDLQGLALGPALAPARRNTIPAAAAARSAPCASSPGQQGTHRRSGHTSGPAPSRSSTRPSTVAWGLLKGDRCCMIVVRHWSKPAWQNMASLLSVVGHRIPHNMPSGGKSITYFSKNLPLKGGEGTWTWPAGTPSSGPCASIIMCRRSQWSMAKRGTKASRVAQRK